jgi:hypothetical protein
LPAGAHPASATPMASTRSAERGQGPSRLVPASLDSVRRKASVGESPRDVCSAVCLFGLDMQPPIAMCVPIGQDLGLGLLRVPPGGRDHRAVPGSLGAGNAGIVATTVRAQERWKWTRTSWIRQIPVPGGRRSMRRNGCRSAALVFALAVGFAASCGQDGNGDKPDGSSDGGADGGSVLRWYQTCGDPVCRPADAGAPSGSPRCTSEVAGAPCTMSGAMCDPGQGCGVLLRCSDRDPRVQPGGCPIARRVQRQAWHTVRRLSGLRPWRSAGRTRP